MTNDRERLEARLDDVGLLEDRLIPVEGGGKASLVRHNSASNRKSGFDSFSGNYGVYAGSNPEGGRWLIDVDVDDYSESADSDALEAANGLPDTFTVKSPHTDGETGGHRYYYIDAKDVPASIEAVAGAKNPGMSWGEIRVHNQYVVGPGSQLDGCSKDWCDECATEDGGRYEIAADRAVAEITLPELFTVLQADESGEAAPQTGAPVDPGETPSADGDASHAERVAEHYSNISDYLMSGSNDRSKSDFHVCCRMIEHGVPESEAYRLLAKNRNSKVDSGDASDDYWGRTWQKAKRQVGEGADTETLPPETTPEDVAGGDTVALPWSAIQAMYADSDTPTSEARYQAVIKLLEENDYATPDDTGEVYTYYEPDGIFERGGEREIEHELQSGLGRHYSQHEKREILGHVKARSYIDRDEFNAGEFDEPLLCVGNGVLNVETREFYDHSPEYLFIRSIPWNYDPDAEAPALEEFMDEVTQREADKKTMYEMVGHALHPDYVRKKFMVLFGPGDNGKTMFYKFVRELLGGLQNVSGIELQKIAENRFASETITGSFANIAPDMAAKKVSDLGDLKTLTGGEDAYFFEPKGKPGYEAVNTATMMFGCNEPPILPERDEAVKTRLVPVELPYRFTQDPGPDPLEKQSEPAAELKEEIVTEEEMSGFLNLALDGLERLLENHDVSLPESHDERLELYEQQSDPIKKFGVKCLENEAGRTLSKDDVYNTYVEFCRENDVKVTTRSVFFEKLRQTTFAYSEGRPASDGRKRYLEDATFTEYARQYADDRLFERTEESDDGAVDSVTPVADIETGFVDLEVEVAFVTDPRPWLEAEGHVKDDSGPVRYIVRGSHDGEFDLQEGETYEITNAEATREEGQPVIELVPNVTEVSLKDETKQTGLEEPQNRTEAATDGGESALEEPDETPTARELEPKAVMYVREEQHGRDGVPREELLHHLVDEHNADRETAERAAEKAAQRPDGGFIYHKETEEYTA